MRLRLWLLESLLLATDAISRAVRWLVAAALHLPTRWGPGDLYAAAQIAPLHVEHGLIDQAADAVDDGDDTELVAARTWPWFKGRYVYQEDDSQ